jgi:hypothetical protein
VKSHELLTDKEVGELWAKAQVPALESSLVIKLICKLVAERAMRYAPYTRYRDDYIDQALKSFGINPATFPGGKT